MRKNNEAELNFAKMVMGHPGKDKVLDRIDTRLLHMFRSGNSEEREQLVEILNSTDLFFKELRIIIDESRSINGEEDE